MTVPSDTFEGSSPHTRGALRYAQGADRCQRIIPAYAGSTRLWRPCRRRPGDHPRIRGEHLKRIKDEMPAEGSSPHTRGAHLRRLDGEDEGRIIPAYAGSTPQPRKEDPSVMDHPRIRGEHVFVGRERDHGGSSPHTRGARRRVDVLLVVRGIIPAYAGSTFTERFLTGKVSDHPRIRGEHGATSASGRGVKGSSPHTRGAPPWAIWRRTSSRIIPAYAGST